MQRTTYIQLINERKEEIKFIRDFLTEKQTTDEVYNSIGDGGGEYWMLKYHSFYKRMYHCSLVVSKAKARAQAKLS